MTDTTSPEFAKSVVNDLYAVQGLSVKEISKQVGKSEPWVYKQLTEISKIEAKNKKLESKTEFVSTNVDDKTEIVNNLRKAGCTLKDISFSLGKSIYFVYSRLDDKYRPKKTNNESLFQEERVIPFLISKGHEIMSEGLQIENDFANLQPDVISIYSNELFITEVKVSMKGHNLQTAIGQTVLNKYIFKESSGIRFQIILPVESKKDKYNITDNLIDFLKYLFQIDIIFI